MQPNFVRMFDNRTQHDAWVAWLPSGWAIIVHNVFNTEETWNTDVPNIEVIGAREADSRLYGLTS